MRLRFSAGLLLAAVAACSSAFAAPQAIEIGPNGTKELPGGREADGIIGDFVLRNDRIEAVVAGNQHQRRANMSVFYDAPVAGCLLDMTLRGTNNDQLTYFGPGAQRGQLSNVRILADGRDGQATVRAELSAAAGNGLYKCHDYTLRDGWAHLLIVSTYRNESAKPIKIRPRPDAVGLTGEVRHGGITAADAPDPAQKQGYAWSQAPAQDQCEDLADEIELAPGEQKKVAIVVAVGTSPAAAFGEVLAVTRKAAPLRIGLREKDGKPATTAAVHLPQAKGRLLAYPDEHGMVNVLVAPGTCPVEVTDIGRPDAKQAIDVKAAGAECEFVLEPASRITFEVSDEDGRPIPCKVQFIGRDGTKSPNLGPKIRAHGCDSQYHSENGRFIQQVPPGKYSIVITHGIEYDHVEQAVDVAPGEAAAVKATLRRVVDTRGWVSTDFHNHTTVSGDNFCGTFDRIINLAAEQVEFAPTTEHNRLFDWKPYIEKLGLADRVATISGLELTGHGAHLNAFPLTVRPYTQDNGAPNWHPDPRVNALTLRAMPGDDDGRWVQINHPQMREFFNDRNNDGKADGGFTGLENMLDGSEMMAHDILSGQPTTTRISNGKPWENWGFLWMQMLNAGRVLKPVVVSDAHAVALGGVGGWRMYVPSSTDEPAKLDAGEVIRNAKAGKRMVTTGPFLEVRTSAGETFGAAVANVKEVRLKVRVQCNTWTDVNRIAVLVNGRVPASLNFTRASHPALFKDGVLKFEHEAAVPLERDAHIIVVAAGEGLTLAKAYGNSWQKELLPIAFGSPIFVDIDGDGFKPNGDTLGHEFLAPAR